MTIQQILMVLKIWFDVCVKSFSLFCWWNKTWTCSLHNFCESHRNIIKVSAATETKCVLELLYRIKLSVSFFIYINPKCSLNWTAFIVLAAYRTSWDLMMRGISETVIYWLLIDWKSAVALKTPTCPHVWFFPLTVLFWQSHGIHNCQAWWRGIHLICTFSQRLFSWFITSYSNPLKKGPASSVKKLCSASCF